MPASMPMLTRERRLILSGATSSAPVAVARSPRSALSVLLRCFSPFVSPTGSAAGCTTGITAPTRSFPSASTAAWMARSLPTSRALMTRTAASSRSSQYCSPLASEALKSSSAIDAPSPTTIRSGSRLPWLIPA